MRERERERDIYIYRERQRETERMTEREKERRIEGNGDSSEAECTKIARISAVAAAILPLPPKSREFLSPHDARCPWDASKH